MTESVLTPIEIGLTAAIVTVERDEPAILVTSDEGKLIAKCELTCAVTDK